MRVHVYVGPSCPLAALTRRHPDLVPHGPASHGDLFDQGLRPGDVAVIIDGVYHHQLALRHKEILDAMARGVTVLGAASIGALRAAELGGHGMVGVGAIHGWYRDGILDGDDEVAVAQRAEPPYDAVTVPMVNVRAALSAAVLAGVLDTVEVNPILDRTRRVYYPTRSAQRVLEVLRAAGGPGLSRWYEQRLAADPYAFDQKRRDTLDAVDAAHRLSPQGLAEPDAGDDRDWRTEFHRRWRGHFHADRHRVTYQQLFHPDFPQTWWRFLLVAQPGLRERAEALAGPAARRWPDTTAGRDRLAALFGLEPDLDDPRHRAVLLSGESQTDRAAVRDCLRRTAEHLHRRPERRLTAISEDTCRRLLADAWRTGHDLDREAVRRGFPSVRRAATALRPFAIGYLQGVTAGPREVLRCG
ncbi:TfuA-like protein [Micromonospora lupini]|uniref:TfuA-like protein n=1 Tax=Micromonospora lupini TaxID=285679 RepID=UPI00340701CC